MSETNVELKERLSRETSKDMMMAFLGRGDAGLQSFARVLKQTKVLTDNLKPEEVEAHNAGMRIIYDMLGGCSQNKLIGVFIRGLGAEYNAYKEAVRKDSSDQQ
jgi:hypothetical protein